MRRVPSSPEAQRVYETPLPPEEFERRLAVAMAEEDEIAAAAELCAWFLRRYPTAAERFAYNNRKYAEQTTPIDVTALLEDRSAEGSPRRARS